VHHRDEGDPWQAGRERPRRRTLPRPQQPERDDRDHPAAPGQQGARRQGAGLAPRPRAVDRPGRGPLHAVRASPRRLKAAP